MDHLLIVDDDEDIRDLYAVVASGLGYHVSEAGGVDECLERYARQAPTVILLDLSMPDGDGVEMLRKFAQLHCDAAVILISGEDTRILNTAKRLGDRLGLLMRSSLQKPVAIDALETALERTLRGSTPLARRQQDMEEPVAEWIEKEQLESAISSDELVLHYQPKVDFESTLGPEIVSCEGLVRWKHPERGILLPGAFVPKAESWGLVGALTEAVLAQAIQQQIQWSSMGISCQISFNLSPSQLTDLSLPDRLADQVISAGVDPSLLTAEVTEQAAMADIAKATDVLTRLRLKGFGVSLDDFGTGYSSLAELYRLPLSEIKFGRVLIVDTDVDRDARVVVRALAALAKTLGIPVCAEGVETKSQARFVRDVGCSVGQGFVFAKALPAVEFMKLYSEQGLLLRDSASDAWDLWLQYGGIDAL
ncbi:MAG: EAL domain-containing protein [Pseudomonadota bacterium]